MILNESKIKKIVTETMRRLFEEKSVKDIQSIILNAYAKRENIIRQELRCVEIGKEIAPAFINDLLSDFQNEGINASVEDVSVYDNEITLIVNSHLTSQEECEMCLEKMENIGNSIINSNGSYKTHIKALFVDYNKPAMSTFRIEIDLRKYLGVGGEE